MSEVEDLPPPFGRDLHMIAYDPKVQTFQEAAELRRRGKTTVAKDHLTVRLVNFMPRDHRVISNEPISDEYDLTSTGRPGGFWGDVALRAGLIWDAMAVFLADDSRIIKVTGEPVAGERIVILLPERALKAAMVRYGLNILGLQTEKARSGP